MRVDTMSKQHLIFMPENGKTHFKFTTELQIQHKQHDGSSCKTCKARMKQCTVNVHANHVQNQILIKQRECSKLWNETLEQIMKGKTTPDRIRHDSSLSDVICLDTDMEDHDIEMVHSPLQLPLLSPINNLRMHTPSKTPNTVTPNKHGNNQSAIDLSLNLSGYTMSTPVKPNLVSKNQTPVKILPPSAKKPLSSHTKKNLIYSKQACSEDHIFWVNKFKKQVQVERRVLHRLKGKLRKAKNYANFVLAASLESEIQAKEDEFGVKHIQRIQVTENLSTHQPMNDEVREAIYNPIKSAELFQVRTSSQQQRALTTLRQYKENLLVLQQLNNKYVPLVANELYYKEQLYKKVYLTPKINDTRFEESFDNSLESSVEANFEKSPKTPKQSNKKVNKRKRKHNKMLKRLKKLGQLSQLLNSADTGNEITKSIETNQDIQSEPTINESLNVYDHNTTNSSESLKTPVSSRGSPRTNNIQPSCGKAAESTPVKFPSASKFPPHRPKPNNNNNNKPSETTPVKLSSISKFFQPYRSLLGFPSVDS